MSRWMPGSCRLYAPGDVLDAAIAQGGFGGSRGAFRECLIPGPRTFLHPTECPLRKPRMSQAHASPMKRLLAPLFASLLGMLPGAHAQTLPNEPVAQLDLARYMGQWHEMAHLPLVFQRQCVGDITAQYALVADGQIQVTNACRTGDGSRDTAIGMARPDGSGRGGALQVRFAPRWLSWLPWVWADYWVVEIDPDYRWAVVGSPSRKYLWILSRSPSMSRAQFNELVARAKMRGYVLDALKTDAPLL